jgi:hypothetical protein
MLTDGQSLSTLTRIVAQEELIYLCCMLTF